KQIEGQSARRIVFAAKDVVGDTQSTVLELCDTRIVHEFRTPQRLDLLEELRHLAEFRDRAEVDVQKIEKQSARRRVRARLAGRERVQRVEADPGGAEPRGKLQQMPEVGEITVPPIAARTHGVKLHGRQPQPPALERKGRLKRYFFRDAWFAEVLPCI